MSRSNTDKAMREYLSALLTEERETLTQPLRHEPVARLLEQVKPEPLVETEIKSVQEEPVVGRIAPRTEPVTKAPPPPEPESEPPQADVPVADAEIIADVEAHKGDAGQPPGTSMEEYQQHEFQALFFKVAGLTLAVPLKSLGGIHSMGKTSTLFGKPDWFVGIMTERDDKLQVVDTARWVMPEKYSEKLASELDYQYLIMLSDSSWGLACEELVTSTTIQPDAIQWRRTDQGKRPWLAGVVREKMCALLNVDELIAMLDKGMGSQQG
ncbi:purine-binding chemotaxis protein CheW [Pseudidiomarina planktonica]|uniref:Purine-binding chemotaxis protein CheW n=1 Tax=Pseudidiomarina planktonica TaxID=1323738 RepID=A0A1Y6EIS8_9GAMM|nr:chemotaxis protein CheW [Pseudidiomarina planktonica]RUO65819.1 chemotaxis protein CheW [Pseudidiomarina planktonica]SMQ62535.1 purine-binding chemotaxis protein CheW [Pseudidiomarina planktonica]